MSWKRALGLALAAIVLALVVYGLFFVKMNTVSIKVDLPPAAPPRSAPKPVEVFIDANGAIQVNGRSSSLDTLARDVGAASTMHDKRQQQVMIRAADTIKYETYIAVLERLRGSGWYKVGIVNEAIPD